MAKLCTDLSHDGSIGGGGGLCSFQLHWQQLPETGQSLISRNVDVAVLALEPFCATHEHFNSNARR